ncbi:MAG: 2-oxo acid dehydrogenase subunit E2, partial [Gemmatimonadetes bacterium]|nr:2-oxo acid dehydrogenase subunit E2 [Gemmatimonadota bacterium]
MARVEVIMPQMGESIVEGTVSKWLKKVGDEIKRDEPILEISTDKVDAEIPSPADGILAEIKVAEGETVEVQTVIAVLETDKDAAVSPAAAPAPAPAPAQPAAETSASPPSAPTPAPAAVSEPVAVPAGDGTAQTAEERLRHRSTPLVRKIAEEHQLDISQIPGTGHAGRVTKKDILEFIESGVAAAPSALGPAAAASPPPSPPGGRVVHPSVEAWAGDRVEPMSRIRRLTADHMVMSRRTSAHVTSFYEIDFTAIARLRQANKQEFQERGAKLTYMAFIVKVVADNLRKHPVLNASVSGNNVIYRKPINIGMAVALDWGLIVPVMRDADELSMLGIAKSIVDLADRARSKRLNPDEVQRGTFTITNPGVFGSYIGTPIINQPQVAILG